MKLHILLLVVAAAYAAPGLDLPESVFQPFYSKFFNEVSKQFHKKNVVVSPISVFIPLGQLFLVTDGKSRKEILNTLVTTDNTRRLAGEQSDRLPIPKYKKVGDVVLNVASRIYVDNCFDLDNDLVKTSQKLYNGDFQNVNFRDSDKAADTISAWVKEKTGDAIWSSYKPKFGSSTLAFIVDAVHFRAKWEVAFDVSSTNDRYFYNDKAVVVPYLHRLGWYGYHDSKTLDAKIVEIKFNSLEDSLVVFLPNKQNGLVELQQKLKDPEVITQAVKNVQSQYVNLHLPKFSIHSHTNLKTVLKNVGVRRIFNGTTAHLNRLFKKNYCVHDVPSKNLHVTDAIQKVVFNIGENGVGADAVNGIEGSPETLRSGADNNNPVKEFDANHPFFFVVKHGNDQFYFQGHYYANSD